MFAIVDYKMGNLRSVAKAFEYIGAKVSITSEENDLRKAKAIVLPGVGAFGQGMRHLEELKIIPALIEEIKRGKPLLGICLGMQLLFSYSEEQGIHKGLNLLEGFVKRFPKNLKVPHMGWNQVKIKKVPPLRSRSRNFFGEDSNIKCEIFGGIPDRSYFYFVHSYYSVPKDKSIILATTDYEIEFPSAIQKDNIFGVQFHPEKSQELGLKIIKNFVKSVTANKADTTNSMGKTKYVS